MTGRIDMPQTEGPEQEANATAAARGKTSSTGKQIGTVSLAESAARRISEMIRRGELQEGQQLSPERELAETLNISRGALREGLRMLETVGLLKARVGSGRYVSVSGSDDLSTGVDIWMQVQAVNDVIAVRRLLEPAAIHAIPATQLIAIAQECAAIMTKMRAAFKKGQHEVALQHHTQFHLALIQHAPTRLHRSLLISMFRASETAQLEIFRTREAGRASIEIHIGILDALKEGNVEETARRDAEHLTPAFAYREALEEAETSEAP